jgi:DNA gyrase subunit A
LVALKNLDDVIDIIRRSRTVETAKVNLRKRFKLSNTQAQAILDMPLRRLASLERRKIDEEYKDVKAQIRKLTSLLRSPVKMRQAVVDELQAVKEKYGDRRRTQIIALKGGKATAPVRMADLTPAEDVWVMVSPEGVVARSSAKNTVRQSGSDAPRWLLKSNNRDTLYLVATNGEAAAIPVHSLPEAKKPSDGLPIPQVSPLTGRHDLATVLSLPPKNKLSEGWYVLTATRGGMVKKTEVTEFPGPAATPFTLVKVNEGDRLGWVKISDGKSDVLLATAKGMAIRFTEDEVRPMGLVAAGVMGIKLKVGDEVIGMDLLPQKSEIFLLTSSGQAKRVPAKDFPKQGRYGQGVVAWKLPQAVRLVGMAVGKGTLKATFHLAKYAAKMARLDDAPLRKRTAARGAKVVEIRADDRIISFGVPWIVPRPLAVSKPKRRTTRKTTKTPKAKTPRRGASSRSGKKKTSQAKK